MSEEKVVLGRKSKYWLGTLIEPVYDDDVYESYFRDFVDSGLLQYFNFQRENNNPFGEHIHILLAFDEPIDYMSLNCKFPFAFHYKPVLLNVEVVDEYVSKFETRISGPYSYGNL